MGTRTHVPADATASAGSTTGRRSADDAVQAGTRCLLGAFAVLTALATHQLLVLGRQTDRFWPWTIHSRPTVGFLAAAYAAGFVLSVLALRQRSWRRVRIAVATVTAFAVLTLVPTVLHAHRLHLAAADPVARGAAWFWVAVYVLVPLAGLGVLARQQTDGGPRDVVHRPVPALLRALLGVQAAVLLAAGLALFLGGTVVHHGMDVGAGFWPWPLTPLGAQVIGAWLLAFGIGAFLVIVEADLTRLRVAAVAYTAFGAFQWVAVLALRAEMSGPAVSLRVYGAVLTVVVLTGGYGWWRIRRVSRAAGGPGHEASTRGGAVQADHHVPARRARHEARRRLGRLRADRPAGAPTRGRRRGRLARAGDRRTAAGGDPAVGLRVR